MASPIQFGYIRPEERMDDNRRPRVHMSNSLSQYQCVAGHGPNSSGRWCRRCKEDESDQKIREKEIADQDAKYKRAKVIKQDMIILIIMLLQHNIVIVPTATIVLWQTTPT